MAYAKISDAVAYATSSYNDFGTVAAMNDGSTSSGWSSARTGATAVSSDYAALQFPTAQKVTKIEVMFYSWGPTIVIGEADAAPAGPGSGDGSGGSQGFRVLRTIDVRVTPNDDLGVPWARGGGNVAVVPYNTILLTNATASKMVGLYTTTNAGSVMDAFNGQGLDRMRIIELNMFTGGNVAPVDGTNPKPPSVVPASPFTATPANWAKRTEFSTAGDFTFTPAADTTLVMAVLQGAGSGGQVLKNLDLSDTTFGTANNGEDSYISTSGGTHIESAGGGQKNLAGAIKHILSTLTPVNWIRYGATAGVAGTAQVAPTGSAPAGAASTLGTAGATYALQQFTGANLGNVDFKSASSESVFPTSAVNGFVRDDTLGWVSQNTGGSTAGSVTFQPIQLAAGQTVNFTYSTSSEVTDRLSITINGTNVVYIGGAITDRVYTYTAATTGSYTIAFSYTKDATVDQGSNRVNVTNMAVSNANYPAAVSGGSGAIQTVYMLPIALNLHVGTGGAGVTGGQTVPANAVGTRGSGGAGGAKGGDGVIVIYEFNDQMPFEKPAVPFTLAQFNTALTTETVGFYRTNYTADDGTTKNVTHQLRPRTKTVIALLVGAGGSVRKGDSAQTAMPDTIVSSSKFTQTAGSGYCSAGPNNRMSSGVGGVYSGTRDPIFAGNGSTGGTGSSSQANSRGIAGGYGDGATSAAYAFNGGGSSAYALVLIGTDDFDNGTLSIQVSGRQIPVSGNYGGAGAVFLFETETIFGPWISQASELILKKEAQTATQVSQGSQLLLKKEAQATTLVGQDSELLLMKESDVVDLQVSYMNAAFVYQYSDPITQVSQESELLLMKVPPVGSYVSQSTELILQKAPILPTRVGQGSELLLIAELPSVFYMDFGTLEYPARNQLYTSITKRATSVPLDAYIQLEGNLAPDSVMYINGVNVGRSSPVKTGDQIYIVSGVPNYWLDKINIYSYSVVNGQVARNLVGVWKVLQAHLDPLKTRAYAKQANYTWIKTVHNIAISNLVPTVTKANSTYGTFVAFLAQKVQNASASLGTKFVQAFSQMFTQATEQLGAAGHSELFRQGDFLLPKAYSVTVQNNGYSETKAKSATLTLNKFGRSRAEYGEETIFDFEQSFPASSEFVREESILTHSHVVGTDILGDANHAGFGTKKNDYLLVNPNKPGTYGADYVPVKFTRQSALFDVKAITTIAYSSLSQQQYALSVPKGTGIWIQPIGLGTVDRVIAAYGTFKGLQYTLVKTHPVLSDAFEGEAQHAPTMGDFYRDGAFVLPVGYGEFEMSVIKRTEHEEFVERIPVLSPIKQVKALLTPYRHEQNVNGIGKASLYKGFDTLSEIQAYTDTYSGVTISTKYNGYVYTLAVDQTFVCEIYFNGPVKWFMQGG